MRRVIIADTSCLIVLDNIGLLHLLQKLYQEVLITPTIASEFGKELPDWIIVEKVLDNQKMQILELELDKGEASAIALCLAQIDTINY